MAGLWAISTQGTDPGIGIVVWQGIVTVVIALCLVASFHLRPGLRFRDVYFVIRLGIVFLILWLSCHWADLVVRHNRTHVKYSYILADAFFNIARLFSEILCAVGVCHILAERRRYRPRDRVIIAVFISPLWILGIYQLCLRFALCFSWLGFANINTTNSIATSQRNIEVSYTTVLFLESLVIFGCSLLNFDDHETNENGALAFAAGAFLLRSFCQIVIIGQLNRVANHFQAGFRGFDATYALFSIAFVAFIEFAIPAETPAEVEQHRTHYASAVSRTRQSFSTLLQSRTRGGQATAPPMTELLDSLAATMDAEGHTSILEYRPEADEIARLRRTYKRWRPIPVVDEM